ncbi:MAG TPA: hypothetical protein VH370_05445 [Humisphaera sp.]|jgi:hypothetical protein|nr:hypothetical protein [Humisphaera sp.]
MRIRFHRNADGEPHIHDHHVEVSEVLDVLDNPLERASGGADTTIVIGRTRGGRVLKVIHAPSRDGDGIFVVTAFDLPAKQVRALNRRLRRRNS